MVGALFGSWWHHRIRPPGLPSGNPLGGFRLNGARLDPDQSIPHSAAVRILAMSKHSLYIDAHDSLLSRFALFNYGFRPFFLLAGLYALAIVPVWLYFYVHHGALFGALPAMYWHSHEMLYGFVMAAIAGFLLTAVPSWTGARGFGGLPLIILVTLWIAGRVAMATIGDVPFWVSAIAELALLPALAALLIPPLFRSANRNTPLLVVLGVLWLIDAAFLVALENGDAALAGRTMNLAIDLVLVLVTVIGGRIVPAFTANALRRLGETADIVSRAWLERTVIALMVAIDIVDVFAPNALLSGAYLSAVGLAQLQGAKRVHSLDTAYGLRLAAHRPRPESVLAAR
jgi:uncharacterized protein involved in response to NO